MKFQRGSSLKSYLQVNDFFKQKQSMFMLRRDVVYSGRKITHTIYIIDL